MRVYLSGPITGHEETAPERFSAAEDLFSDFGEEVINPWKIAEAIGAKLTHEEYMRIDFFLLYLCDAIYLLDGWQDSAGCRREMEEAQRRNMGVFYQDVNA